MASRILDGRWLSEQVERELRAEVSGAVEKGARPPGLGVVLVGENPASLAYVGRKEKVAKRCGFYTREERLPAGCTQSELTEKIHELNRDDAVDGILLQLPLPDGLNEMAAIDAIDPVKDADGLHPQSQGYLLRGGRMPSGNGFFAAQPCTPAGLLKLIDLAFSEGIYQPGEAGSEQLPETIEHDLSAALQPIDLSGKSAVVVGRSLLVGKSAALLLLERNATVTIAHSRTENLAAVTAQADIVVAAVGRELFLGADAIREGAVVIDVGINRNKAGKLVGDVDFGAVAEKTRAITPVPGGVGPMTVIQLMENTFRLYEQRMNERGEDVRG
ncbi:bifunctional 5,10-methylenetetrahydrofolate dehydrogenase/5,10-methenyltetrahydrofolate cyclohydrolase [bacterium]|nr:bifunctional 5,10-methylenetetrahydrofolate dehydrogenase/5,10-methenyltetrahydrofolate cyclohydrolase [bacterium]